LCKELYSSQNQHLREVETSIMPIGNTNIHKQINVSGFINVSVSFAFCELNLVAK